MVEPMPPSDRNSSSCQYDWAKAHAAVDSATITNPLT